MGRGFGHLGALGRAGGLTDPQGRKIVWSRGAMNSDLTTDVPAGQRATLGSSRMIVPYSVVAPEPTAGIQFVFWVGYNDASTLGEKTIANTSTWRAGFEANGQTKQLTFSGQSSATMGASLPGGAPSLLFSDRIYPADVGLSVWPTTGSAFIRTDVTVPSGGSIPGFSQNGGSGEAVRFSADLGTYQSGNTGALSTPSGAQTFGFSPGPVAIIGQWPSGIVPLPSFAGNGDSIMDYTGDNTDTGTGSTSGGFFVRAMRGNNIPYIKMSRGSDGYASASLANQWATRKYLTRFATHLIDEMGINGGALTAAQEFAIASSLYSVARASGVQWVGRTSITPSGSSSNSFIDKAGQTPFQSNGGTQDQFNALMLAALGTTIDSYIDTRTALGDATDKHYWLTNGVANYPTSDGTHPSPTFHGFMAATIISSIPTIAPVVYAASPTYQILDFAGYSTERSTLATNNKQGPSYQTTAALVTEDTTTANGHDIIKNAIFSTTAKTYVATVYVKRVTGSRNFQLVFFDTGFGSSVVAKADLSNNSLLTAATVTGSSFSAPSATVSTGPLGYAKIVLTFTAVSGQSLWASLGLLSGSNSSYDGDGTSSVAMWGLDVR